MFEALRKVFTRAAQRLGFLPEPTPEPTYKAFPRTTAWIVPEYEDPSEEEGHVSPFAADCCEELGRPFYADCDNGIYYLKVSCFRTPKEAWENRVHNLDRMIQETDDDISDLQKTKDELSARRLAALQKLGALYPEEPDEFSRT